MHREIPYSEPHFRGVFTTGEAHDAGWTRSALAHAERSRRLVRLQNGIYVDAASWTGDDPEDEKRRLLLRAIGAHRAIAPSAVSHLAAALLYDLPIWNARSRACVTVRPTYTGDAQRVHLHRASTGPGHVIAGSGLVSHTSPGRTVLEAAREFGTEDALVIADAAANRGLITEYQLARCAEYCDGWPGFRRALAALRLVDGRSESPLETVSRLRLLDRGIPSPELQTEIWTPTGRLLGRVDLYWDEFGVAGEVDGRMKYQAAPEPTLWREKRRQEPMEDTGLIFIRWGLADLDDMDRLVERLRLGFARGARRPRSDRAWKTHFAPLMHTGRAG